MARRIEVEITGDASSLNRALGSVSKSGSKFGHVMGSVVRGGAIAAGAAFVGLAAAAKIGWDEFSQGTKVAAQTNAVLKSTGGVANVTAKHVDDLGSKLMELSGIDDEVIKGGENLLLTFRGIRNEVGAGNDIFDQATKATLDMSVAMGKDLNSSVILVGKALQDPIRGLSALRRVGVQLTTSQEALITKLVETGHTMRAQKIILGELNKEFGGSAKAAGETLPGKINILKESFRNFTGDIVARTVPVLTNVLDFLNKIGKAKGITAKIRVVWQGLGDLATGFWDAVFKGHTTVVRGEMGKIIRVEDTQSLAAQFTAAIVAAVKAIDWGAVARGAGEGTKSFWDKIGDIGGGGKGSDQDRFVRFIGLDPDKDYGDMFDNWLRGQMGKAGKALNPKNWAWHHTGDWISEQLGLPGAKKTLSDFSDWIGSIFSQMVRNSISHTFQPLAKMVGGWLHAMVAVIKQIVGGVPGAITSALSGVGSAILGAFYGPIHTVLGWIQSVLDLFSRLPGGGTPTPGPGSTGGRFGGVPQAATGGDIARTGLALVHRGERVVPARVVNRGGGGGPMTVNVVLDGKVLASVLVDLDRDHRKANGGRPLFA